MNLFYANSQQHFRVMSYNVENLLDTKDNPKTIDDEFLPKGSRYWTNGRYIHKLQQIAKVISAAGEWDTPAIVGLCEIENDSVLDRLVNQTSLRLQQYRYCLTSTSDQRGINVALLYQRDKFGYIAHHSHPVRFASGTIRSTRDILHVYGEIISGDTLDVFVCHFPSRYGGEKESENRRLEAARTLRLLCDSLYNVRKKPQFLIMGDFNDTPGDKSLRNILTALPYSSFSKQEKENLSPKDQLQLYNLFADSDQFRFPGSHKYQGEWNQLDHIIVNKELLDHSSAMCLDAETVRLFAPDFLLVKDKTWHGLRPKRTYYGFKYEKGYSDHLPLLADFYITF
ncbi:endonuclease/exonuclease/phosphatase family protein [Parabacteroides sp. PF5-9]|uniref:endonuclease/exonuclease/phosphatase family protein n=1 Tax=Parabacteroides sp. PF5-9 TaxID=1742404 RepID=UPI0024772D4F|nr:endonuclease/exonuclease/phosphatase family protein [Parabacteroides sp. PF5-9]